jgi:serine/threonine protein kinase
VSERSAPSFELDELSSSRTTPVLPLGANGEADHEGDGEDGGNAGHAAGDAEPTAPGKASAAGRHPATEKQARPPRQQARRSSKQASTSRSGSGESRFLAGAMLGRYRIVRLLGRGGMGEVYCAEDLELGQMVALKLLPEAWEQNEARLERLRSEVRLARSVTHANVCRVYDIGGDEGRRFLSMEYIDGEDLDALLRRIGRVAADKAVEIGAQLCHGLAAIHDRDILHRDLKPANIMLDAHGCVHIADFGLASMVEEAAEQGMVQGTPAYMAPEQLGAQQVSIQSDLYALGLILHKLLTGKPAFEARTPMELLEQRVRSAPPPPSAQVSGIPPAIDAIIARCLAPDPRLRPASAREVAAALASVTATGQAAMLVVAVASTGLDTAALAAQLGDDAVARLAQAHADIVDALCQRHAAMRVRDAEAPLVLFAHLGAAVQYALAYQRDVQALAQRESVALAIGVGMQLGVQPRAAAEDTATPRLEVDAATRELAARLSKLAEPGQILLARSVFDLARQDSFQAPGKLQWLAHGSYELAGMAEPVDVCEVGIEGVAPLAPPRGSELAQRRNVQDVVTGWRPAPGMELPRRPHWIMERKLGQGGFGEVWLAVHAKTHEPRVFKFCYDADKLRALQREITLFRLLKEALGERGDIVRILDWDFDEAPYFIESAYTAGGNLIEWALDRGGLDAIPLEVRLEIVAQVATALAAAHSVGVLHKDVKPGNVLMTVDGDGSARAQLGDFGIGAITEKQRLAEAGITAMGMTVDARTNMAIAPDGTRLYMAPETLEGKPATIQADIYALGVMLYQIVVGDFARALAPGWERDVEDELVRADIAAAVDGDPRRRLGDAGHLAGRLRSLPERRQELERFRLEIAEHAHAQEEAKRAQEEAERALAALALARKRRKVLALAVAVLALFAGIVTVQSLRIAQKAREAELARQDAERNSRTAEQVSDFLVELFGEADPYVAQGRDVTAREILERGKAKIGALADQPEVQATLMHVMGVVYGNIGLYQESAALLKMTVEKRRQLHGDQHILVADSLHELARTLKLQTLFAPAKRAAREALDLRRTLLGSANLDTGEAMETLADVLIELGSYREAEPLYQEVLAMRRQILGPEHAKVAQGLRQMGLLHLRKDKAYEAMRWFRESLDMYRRLPGGHMSDISETLYHLGLAHAAVSDYPAAETFLLESLDISARSLGNEHPRTYHAKGQLARVYQRTGEYEKAEPLWHEVLEFYRKSMGEENLNAAAILSDLAFLARARGDCIEANALSEKSFSIVQGSVDGNSHDLVISLYHRAYLLASWGDHAAAASHYRSALEMHRRLSGEATPVSSMLMASLAEQYLAQGNQEQAQALLVQAIPIVQWQVSRDELWLRPYVESVQGSYLAMTGDPASAERLLLQSYHSMRNIHGAYRIYTKLAAERIVKFYEGQGRSAQATKYGSLPIDPPCTSVP